MGLFWMPRGWFLKVSITLCYFFYRRKIPDCNSCKQTRRTAVNTNVPSTLTFKTPDLVLIVWSSVDSRSSPVSAMSGVEDKSPGSRRPISADSVIYLFQKRIKSPTVRECLLGRVHWTMQKSSLVGVSVGHCTRNKWTCVVWQSHSTHERDANKYYRPWVTNIHSVYYFVFFGSTQY